MSSHAQVTQYAAAAIDDRATSTHDILGLAQVGLPMAKREVNDDDSAWAMTKIEAVAAERGWTPHPESPPVQALVGVLCTLREVGHEWVLGALDRYAEAADRVAEADIHAVARLGPTEAIVEGAVVGTVLGDALLAALRRIAHAQRSRDRFDHTTSEIG